MFTKTPLPCSIIKGTIAWALQNMGFHAISRFSLEIDVDRAILGQTHSDIHIESPLVLEHVFGVHRLAAVSHITLLHHVRQYVHSDFL